MKRRRHCEYRQGDASRLILGNSREIHARAINDAPAPSVVRTDDDRDNCGLSVADSALGQPCWSKRDACGEALKRIWCGVERRAGAVSCLKHFANLCYDIEWLNRERVGVPNQPKCSCRIEVHDDVWEPGDAGNHRVRGVCPLNPRTRYALWALDPLWALPSNRSFESLGSL